MVPENIDRWTFEAVEELCSTGLGESDRHDFKLGLQDHKNTAKICCAFANSVGGFLIYGVRQRSSSFIPEGIEADSEFSAKLRQRIKADPHVDISLPRLVPVPSARKRLIYVFEVPSSARRPHLPSVPEDRFFWKRSNSTCERMTLEEIRYQMLSYEEKKEKLILLVIDLDVKAA